MKVTDLWRFLPAHGRPFSSFVSLLFTRNLTGVLLVTGMRSHGQLSVYLHDFFPLAFASARRLYSHRAVFRVGIRGLSVFLCTHKTSFLPLPPDGPAGMVRYFEGPRNFLRANEGFFCCFGSHFLLGRPSILIDGVPFPPFPWHRFPVTLEAVVNHCTLPFDTCTHSGFLIP